MARLEDVPEGPLRDLAGRIPPGVLADLAGWEVDARLGEARILIGLAAEMEPGEAMKARLRADRILKAQPLEEHIAELGRLDVEMKAAAAVEDFDAAGRAFARLLRAQVMNPMPEAVLKVVMPATAAELDDRHKAPSRVLGVRR